MDNLIKDKILVSDFSSNIVNEIDIYFESFIMETINTTGEDMSHSLMGVRNDLIDFFRNIGSQIIANTEFKLDEIRFLFFTKQKWFSKIPWKFATPCFVVFYRSPFEVDIDILVNGCVEKESLPTNIVEIHNYINQSIINLFLRAKGDCLFESNFIFLDLFDFLNRNHFRVDFSHKPTDVYMKSIQENTSSLTIFAQTKIATMDTEKRLNKVKILKLFAVKGSTTNILSQPLDVYAPNLEALHICENLIPTLILDSIIANSPKLSFLFFTGFHPIRSEVLETIYIRVPTVSAFGNCGHENLPNTFIFNKDVVPNLRVFSFIIGVQLKPIYIDISNQCNLEKVYITLLLALSDQGPRQPVEINLEVDDSCRAEIVKLLYYNNNPRYIHESVNNLSFRDASIKTRNFLNRCKKLHLTWHSLVVVRNANLAPDKLGHPSCNDRLFSSLEAKTVYTFENCDGLTGLMMPCHETKDYIPFFITNKAHLVNLTRLKINNHATHQELHGPMFDCLVNLKIFITEEVDTGMLLFGEFFGTMKKMRKIKMHGYVKDNFRIRCPSTVLKEYNLILQIDQDKLSPRLLGKALFPQRFENLESCTLVLEHYVDTTNSLLRPRKLLKRCESSKYYFCGDRDIQTFTDAILKNATAAYEFSFTFHPDVKI